MEQRSLNEQFWSANPRCFGCGVENPMGLHLTMYERDGAVIARWEPRAEYEGWNGIIHGGVLMAALDELGGGAAWLGFLRRDDKVPSVVSTELTVRFRAPARLGRTLEGVAQLTALEDRRALVDVRLLDGDTEVASMTGRYVKVDQIRIHD